MTGFSAVQHTLNLNFYTFNLKAPGLRPQSHCAVMKMDLWSNARAEPGFFFLLSTCEVGFMFGV